MRTLMLFAASGVIGILGGLFAGAAEPLKVGDAAPKLAIKLDDGSELDPSEPKRPVVLYFYPKDDTPGCTKEACTFRDRTDEVAKTGALVVGVSFDPTESHKKFREKYSFKFPLATDDGKIAAAFGVAVRGVAPKRYHARDTIVIDAAGKVLAVFRGVDPVKGVDDVLAALAKKGETPPAKPDSKG